MGNDMTSNADEIVLSILARKVGMDSAKISLDMRLRQDLRLDADDAVEFILEISNLYSKDV